MTKIKRLLEAFEPSRYDVAIDINEEKLTFEGSVTITGNNLTSTNEITLHAKDLTLSNASINGAEASIGTSNAHHECSLTSEQTIPSGETTIKIDFSGDVSDSMVGIYASSFTYQDTKKHIIATQFESNHAREAIPCIDEPAAKAVFQLTLTAHAAHTALSNTPLQSSSIEGDRETYIFEPTPRMSPYLLVFATGDIQRLEGESSNGTKIGAYASVAQEPSSLEYAVAEGIAILDFFEEYFQVPFPLPKLDMLALPDFDAGAMENWGLITFREVVMLTDPDNRSISSEQLVSMVIAHEISHMWFGNLVTMEWWDDLWLNESFASLMEHVALNAVHPDWQQWEQYAASDILTSTSRDIHGDIQPISIELDDPELIETMFDPGIVYTKGGRLLKMLMEHIGEDAFRAGLKRYFEKHSFSNTVRGDLWAALGEASGEDVDALMSPWLDQAGMPLLRITQKGHTLAMHQERFVSGGKPDGSVWPIPTLAEPTIDTTILTQVSDGEELNSAEFVAVNTSASGHYITYYTERDHRAHIAEMVAKRQLSSPARINILNDMILLSKNALIPFTDALDMIAPMQDEDRYPVWTLMARVIGTAQMLTEGDEQVRDHINLMRLDMASKRYAELGHTAKDSDDSNDEQMRSLLLSFMLSAKDKDTLRWVESLMSEAKSPTDLPSESRSIMLGTLIRDGNATLARELLELYPSATSEMQNDIVHAVSSTKDNDLAQEILSRTLTKDTIVRPQDILRWLVSLLRNHHIREVVWDHMVEHWDWLEATLLKSKAFDFLPAYCAGVISTEDMAKRYRELFVPLKEHKLLKRNIAIGLSDIDTRVAWRTENEQAVADWFSAYSKSSSSSTG